MLGLFGDTRRNHVVPVRKVHEATVRHPRYPQDGCVQNTSRIS